MPWKAVAQEDVNRGAVRVYLNLLCSACQERKSESETMAQYEAIAAALIRARGSTPKEEVCQAVGISLAALEAYESGKRVPRDSIKYRLAKYYHKGLGELFFAPDGMTK